MKIYKKIISLLVVLGAVTLFFIPLPAASGQKIIKFQHINTEVGLSQNIVSSILQDSYGFIWIATDDGLNRYDGHTFKVYNHIPGDESSLGHDRVRSLYEDRQKRLWVGTMGGGLHLFNRERDTFTRYTSDPANPATISENTISAMREDSNGDFWVGTMFGGFNKFDRDAGTFQRFRQQPDSELDKTTDSIQWICEGDNGILWLASWGGLVKFNRNTHQFKTYPFDLADLPDRTVQNRVMHVYKDRSGVLWVGTYEGLFQFDVANETFISFRNRFPGPKDTLDNRVYSILEDRMGDMWVGTFGGICKMNRKRDKAYVYRAGDSSMYGLSSDYVLCMYEDRSEVFWVGTYSGVDKFDNKRQKFTHYPVSRSGKSKGNYVFAVHEDSDGILWLGTFNEGLSRFDRATGELREVNIFSETKNNQAPHDVLYIMEGSQGYLWVATIGQGLKRIHRRTFEVETYLHYKDDPTTINSNVVHRMMQDRPGRMWVSTSNGLSRFDMEKGIFTRYQHNPDDPSSLSHNDCYATLLDSAGVLWASTYGGGINRFNPANGTFTRFRHIPGDPTSLSKDKVYVLHEDRAGNFWIGTNSGGLNKFDREKGTFSHFTKEDGLPNNVIFTILEDDNGNLWLSTNKGISRFTPSTGEFKNYDLSDGLQGYEFSVGAYYKSRSGEMFFGGANGLNAFFPDKIVDNHHIPPIVITDFKIANRSVRVGPKSVLKRPVYMGDTVKLSHRHSTFSFEFAALDYTAPGTNQYKYKMEGFNNDWIDLGNKHDITFTNLDPGPYVFRIIGSNNDDVWNHGGASVKVIVSPPFWRTLWFQALMVLLVVFLFISFHRYRMQHLRLHFKTEAQMNNIYERYKVSSREQEIIDLIIKGKSNKEIEEELFISIRTVKTHIYKIYQKFGVKNRLELINVIQKSTRQ